VTSVRPDGDGGFVVERESEWTDEDVALLIASKEQAAGIGPHGISMLEAMDPLADPNRRFEGWHYEARVRIDFAQRALNVAQQERAEKYPDEDRGSLRWSLERIEDGPPSSA